MSDHLVTDPISSDALKVVTGPGESSPVWVSDPRAELGGRAEGGQGAGCSPRGALLLRTRRARPGSRVFAARGPPPFVSKRVSLEATPEAAGPQLAIQFTAATPPGHTFKQIFLNVTIIHVHFRKCVEEQEHKEEN